MDFDKTKIFTTVNADEVKIGSIGYFGDTLDLLSRNFLNGEHLGIIDRIETPNNMFRFSTKNNTFNLFYLIEEPKAEEKYRPYKNTEEMTGEEFVRQLERTENCYQLWHARFTNNCNLEKQTIEDLMREAFFAGYEEGADNV